MHPDVKVLESYVPLSAARGGNPNFRRDDLLYELTWEDKQLAMRSRLDALDRELHDAHATNKEYMEVKALHGYATMMWTNNAYQCRVPLHAIDARRLQVLTRAGAAP
jgi:hypothetical protein